LQRLTEEKRFAQIKIDIPVEEGVIIRETFDWDLNQENVSVKEFTDEFCDELDLSEEVKRKIFKSIIF